VFKAFMFATLAALAAGVADAQQLARCDRACLTGFIDAYFAALIANDAKKLPQAAKARITENGSEKPLAATFWIAQPRRCTASTRSTCCAAIRARRP